MKNVILEVNGDVCDGQIDGQMGRWMDLSAIVYYFCVQEKCGLSK